MLAHAYDLGNDGDLGPLDTKNLSQFLEIYSSGFAYAEYGVSQPGHAQVSKLLVEKRFPQLRCEKRDVLDDRLPDTP
jgi:hypothetical protein